MIAKLKTREIQIGNVKIGGGNPVAVQSMCSTDTRNVTATVEQIKRLEEAGCEMVRVAVPDMKAAEALSDIKKQIKIPLIADIHFNYVLAIEAAKRGVDKLRINPGNIGGKEKIKMVLVAAEERGIPIRVGVNQGSVEKDLLEKYGHPTPEALVESALRNVGYLAEYGFENIVVSLKASDPKDTVAAYTLFSQKVDYPLHLGVTEAGPVWSGTIRSTVALGNLLYHGIGDTLRVSLTGDVVEEVKVGWEILKSLGLRVKGPTLISCPTCGRIEVDLLNMINDIEQVIKTETKPVKISVMGCVVNGPGEAREAPIGVIGGSKGVLLLTRHGKIVKRLKGPELVDALKAEIKAYDPATNTFRDEVSLDSVPENN
ncbi:MAG: flavodoxin-dependent (E)-4-hydroxy-3-methylbut-2-enyl-diphosphate synthase [candidate division Zixibacteria bacterium]|nr:flavodoxin-dependent (E)-4-hydroxy-3-methylbut-2-enyl-diphosphate synthase [candidate division Zixibacteria bacterium]